MTATSDQLRRVQLARLAAQRHKFASCMLYEAERLLLKGIEPVQPLREALAASQDAQENERHVPAPAGPGGVDR